MKKLLIILFAVSLMSCGSNYHLKRMNYHEMKAISKGAVIKNDTIYGLRKFKFPAVNVKFEPKLIGFEDRYRPFLVIRDSIQVKIQWKKGQVNGPDTVFVEVRVPEKEVTAKVPISVDKKIGPSSKRHWPWVLLLGIIIGATGTILIVRKLKITIQSRPPFSN